MSERRESTCLMRAFDRRIPPSCLSGAAVAAILPWARSEIGPEPTFLSQFGSNGIVARPSVRGRVHGLGTERVSESRSRQARARL